MLFAFLLLLAQDQPSRAEANFVGVMNGSVLWGSLSEAERAEVTGVARIVRGARRAWLPPRDRCLLRELGDEPSRVARAVADLKCGQR